MTDQVLYKFKEYVQLLKTDGKAPNTNRPMNQYSPTIYKGVTNTIDFVIRNNDRQPVKLVGYQIVALIQSVDHPEHLLTKPLIINDELAGKAQLILLESDINAWLNGFYNYTIKVTDITGKNEFLYTNINRSTIGVFELVDGVSASLAPAICIQAINFTPLPPTGYNNLYSDYDNVWGTGALPGDAQVGQSNGMHTVAVYTSNNFLGEFYIQASLTSNAPILGDWFDIKIGPDNKFCYTLDYSPNIKVFNFTGNYYWIRFIFMVDPKNQGTFDKILYKN